MEERLRSHYESLSRVIAMTRAADAKAAPILGLQTALVGTLAIRSNQLSQRLTDAPWDMERIILSIAVAAFVTSVVWTVALAARVYLPINPPAKGSLIYFEDIGSMAFEKFSEKSRQLDQESIEEELLDQIYRVSRVASAKMRRVRRAFIASGPSGVLWLTLLVWSGL